MIVPIKKANISFNEIYKDQILTKLQSVGVFMFESPPKTSNDEDVSPYFKTIERIDSLIKGLKPYSHKGMLPLSALPEIDKEEFERFDAGNLSAVEYGEKTLSEISGLKDSINQNDDMLKKIIPWEKLLYPVEQLTISQYTETVFGTIPSKQTEAFIKAMSGTPLCYEIIDKTKDKSLIVASFMREAHNECMELLDGQAFEPYDFPGITGAVGHNISELSGKIEESKRLLDEKERNLKHLYPELIKELCIVKEKCRARIALEQAPLKIENSTVYIDGWIRADNEALLKNELNSVCPYYTLNLTNPKKDGNSVPTALKNNKFVRQFEGITSMFTFPSYDGTDPNPIMAPWYWIIFGLMMGDAGYGLLLAVLILIVKKLIKPTDGTESLLNVMLFSSVTTIISGIMFGSYFGETWKPIFISPSENPVGMLVFTFIVGALHIFTGLIAKIVINVQMHHILDAILDQLSWIVVISGIGLMFLNSTRSTGIVLTAVGAAVIFFTAGRRSKNIPGKIMGGLVGLYGITGYMSDILSYSRIFALSLASGVIGMVINMLAGMIQGSVLGFMLSLVIYAVGHIFNLVLSLLSAYVHDCRLQYIEFYGKFYNGGGRMFEPFAIKPKYIKLK